MKDKKAIVCKTAFFLPPKSTLREPKISAYIMDVVVIKEPVYNALIGQST